MGLRNKVRCIDCHFLVRWDETDNYGQERDERLIGATRGNLREFFKKGGEWPGIPIDANCLHTKARCHHGIWKPINVIPNNEDEILKIKEKNMERKE